MTIATTDPIERIARVLSGQRLSANADGDDRHAAERVDQDWSAHVPDAIAVLKTLRDPDADMANAGDAAIWHRMIDAALGAAPSAPAEPHAVPEPGTDPLHEGP